MGYLGIVLRGRDMPVRASTGTASDAIIGVLGLSSGESKLAVCSLTALLQRIRELERAAQKNNRQI